MYISVYISARHSRALSWVAAWNVVSRSLAASTPSRCASCQASRQGDLVYSPSSLSMCWLFVVCCSCLRNALTSVVVTPIEYGPGVHFLWGSIFYGTYRIWTPIEYGPGPIYMEVRILYNTYRKWTPVD